MDTTRNAETPQFRAQNTPKVTVKTAYRKKYFGCLCDNRPVASRRFETFNLATLQLATA